MAKKMPDINISGKTNIKAGADQITKIRNYSNLHRFFVDSIANIKKIFIFAQVDSNKSQ